MDSWFESGRVAIVTGGSRGLGKELARELLMLGVFTIIDGRDRAVLEAATAELSRLGELIAIPGDVSESAHAHDLIAAARERGRLDLLINNASTLGEVPLPSIDHLTPTTLSRLFDVNLFAPIHLVQHALPMMGQAGATGIIVNITSDAGIEAYPGWGGYGATKAALEHISRVLAAELDGNVRVLVVDPGDMNTQMHRDAIPDAEASELRDPADAARALLRAIAVMREPYERVRLADVVLA